LVEEERLPDYDAHRHFPVRLGGLFNGIYQVIGKLGYGVNGTICLAKDMGR
ncbi:hypothetical protein EV421DRAFT_1719746, partial [Armillaria borealis]